MPLEFNPLKTNGVYSKIFINKASYMLIKINTTPFAHMEEDTDHFIDKISIREAAVLQKIGSHPNIITPKFISLRKPPDDNPILLPKSKDKTPRPSQACLTIGMELGEVLGRKKKGTPAPEPGEIATFLHHVAAGLAYAHRQDIAHRDVKPDNIIKTADGFYQLIDWGLAGLASSEKQSDSKHYVTRWYRPPELLDKEIAQTDHRAADVWALAITTLEIFSNPARLFAKTVRSQLATAIHLSKQTTAQFQTLFQIPLPFADLLSAMLSRSPGARITAENILAHPFISQYTAYSPPPSIGPFQVHSPRPSCAGVIPFLVREKICEWLCSLWAYYPNHLRTIVLFTAYEILDRYSRLAKLPVLNNGYQIIGCGAMAIADSLYDTWALSHEDYVTAAGNIFTVADLEETIISISKVLEWNLYIPGVYTQWKLRVRNSDSTKAVIALAAIIADRKKYRWSGAQIVNAALQTRYLPKRFALFRQLLSADQPPPPVPLIF